MGNVRVSLNHKGMAELLKDEGVRRDLTRRADRVLAVAKATAPRDAESKYADELHVEQATHDRAVVRVASDEPYAMRVEADHGTLARALRAAAGRL